RVHGELMMLGIEISERTVSRMLRTLRRPPTQTWKTFLHNHLDQLVSIDFFTVPTVTLRVLFVFIVLDTVVARYCTSMSLSIPPRPGHPSRSSRLSPIGKRRGILYEIGMASTAARSDCGSRHCT